MTQEPANESAEPTKQEEEPVAMETTETSPVEGNKVSHILHDLIMNFFNYLLWSRIGCTFSIDIPQLQNHFDPKYQKKLRSSINLVL